MLGGAVTSQFLLGQATVMLGPMTDLFNLNPSAHGIGLTKNFSFEVTPQFQNLPEGTAAAETSAIGIGAEIKISMDLYEFTAKNLAYAAGLNGAGDFAPQTAKSIVTAYSHTAPTHVTVADASGFAFGSGQILMIQNLNQPDLTLVRKQVNLSGNTLTVNPAISLLDIDGNPIELSVGSSVSVANEINVGVVDTPNFLSAKVVGELANGDLVTILIPKVVVTKGLSVGFDSPDFKNMPVELSVYDLSSADPNYSWFGPSKAKIYASH